MPIIKDHSVVRDNFSYITPPRVGGGHHGRSGGGARMGSGSGGTRISNGGGSGGVRIDSGSGDGGGYWGGYGYPYPIGYGYDYAPYPYSESVVIEAPKVAPAKTGEAKVKSRVGGVGFNTGLIIGAAVVLIFGGIWWNGQRKNTA